MATSPLPFLIIITLTLTFEGLYFGQDLFTNSYPEFKEVNFGACTGNPLDVIGCWFANIGAIIANIAAAIFGTVVFFFNLLSFNIPGTPPAIRAILGTIFTGGIIWSIASLIRGN